MPRSGGPSGSHWLPISAALRTYRRATVSIPLFSASQRLRAIHRSNDAPDNGEDENCSDDDAFYRSDDEISEAEDAPSIMDDEKSMGDDAKGIGSRAKSAGILPERGTEEEKSADEKANGGSEDDKSVETLWDGILSRVPDGVARTFCFHFL